MIHRGQTTASLLQQDGAEDIILVVY
jgi:hypothetical protein